MLAALALAAPAQGAAASSKGKGKGKGKGKPSANTSAVETLTKLIPVVVSLERRVHTLEDRSSFIVAIKDEGWKVKIEAIRALWRTQEKTRRDAAAGSATAMADVRGDLAPHPLGGPLRSIILKTFVELVAGALPADHPHKAAMEQVAKEEVSSFTAAVYRAQPRHPQYKADRTWFWGFMLVDGATSTSRELFTTLTSIKHDFFFVAAQHSQDGPLTKWLLEWQKAHRSDQGNYNNDDEEDDSYGNQGDRKRTRNQTRW